MLERLAEELQSKNFRFEEAMVFKDGNAEFWQSTLLDDEENPVSSGMANGRLTSRKIALAEYLERRYYRQVVSSDLAVRRAWGIDIIPTACGFAAGFNRDKTIFRSLAEATERWTMTRWIDDGFAIAELQSSDVMPSLDDTSKFLAGQFEKVLFFKKDVLVHFDDKHFVIPVAQTMGLVDGGIYPGSSAQFTGGSIWQHALVESFRHLLLVRNNNVVNKFPDNKIRYFAKNADLALSQIEKAKKEEWPTPEVLVHKSFAAPNDDYYISRTVFSGWTSWHEGPLERFLY